MRKIEFTLSTSNKVIKSFFQLLNCILIAVVLIKFGFYINYYKYKNALTKTFSKC
jgi:hypothetical protein